MYLIVTARKGISSMQMAKEIGVTQKTAWFMLQRLREACEGKTGRDLDNAIVCDDRRDEMKDNKSVYFSNLASAFEVRSIATEKIGSITVKSVEWHTNTLWLK